MRSCLAAARTASILGVAGLILTGCRDPSARYLPPSAPELTVTMDEYAFAFKKRVPRGRVVFRVGNSGRRIHRPALVRIPPDLQTTLSEQIASGERRQAEVVYMLPAMRPGQEGVFAADLPEGRFGFVCFLRDPDGASHAVKGMVAEFRSGG